MWSMTKKRSSEILADENRENFRKNVKLENFPRSLRNVSKIGEEIRNRGECIIASEGMDTPAHLAVLAHGSTATI